MVDLMQATDLGEPSADRLDGLTTSFNSPPPENESEKTLTES